MLMKSKRGEVPVVILVIGVVAICIFALLSFAFSFNISNKDFISINSLENVSAIEEQVQFYKNLGLNPENYLDVKYDGKLYYVIDKQMSNGEIKFMVEYEFP